MVKKRGQRPVEDIVLQTPAVVAQASTQDYLSEQLAEVDKIAVGTWMEFKETDGSRRRAKLSAWLRDGDGQRLLFVNRSGVKVVEKSRSQLALDLRNKSASVLDDRLLFDRALEAVVGSLRTIGKGKVV